jgi:hypothetical protein
VNKALRYGHVMAVEALYLKAGTLADLPHLAEYIREAVGLRRRLMDNLWWASLVEPDFATIEHSGAVKVGAFRSWSEQPATGSPLALVLHHFTRESQPVRITFAEAKYRAARLYRPFAEPETTALPFATDIPPDRVLIVLPMDA